MGYIIRQIAAAAVVLISIGALMEREIVNNWLFNGLGGWVCIVVPLGAIIISVIHMRNDEPKEETGEEDWKKNFKPNSLLPPPRDLSAQRIHRAKK